MSDGPHELVVERRIAAAPDVVYRVWTTRLGEWWAPAPYTTPGVVLDLRPGGEARMDMRAPDGTDLPNRGVFLEVEPGRRLVFTNAFTAGWVPQEPFMVVLVTFESDGKGGTAYAARARHWSAEAKAQHAAMGFSTGWATVAAQLAALAEAEAGG